jgi:hypothetical protein
MSETEEYIGIWRAFNIINILNPYLFYIFVQQISKKFNRSLSVIFALFGIVLIFLNYYKNILIPDVILEMTGYELFTNIWAYNLLVLYSGILFLFSSICLYRYYIAKSIAIRRLLIL